MDGQKVDTFGSLFMQVVVVVVRVRVCVCLQSVKKAVSYTHLTLPTTPYV